MWSLPMVSMALQMSSHVVTLGIVGCFTAKVLTLGIVGCVTAISTLLAISKEDVSFIVDGPELSDSPVNVEVGFFTAGVLEVIFFCLGPMVATMTCSEIGLGQSNMINIKVN